MTYDTEDPEGSVATEPFLLAIFKTKMFFFRKKPGAVVSRDVIWKSEEEKFAGLTGFARANPEALFVFWFDETGERLSPVFEKGGLSTERLADAKRLRHFETQGRSVVFVEHHPLRQKEEDLYKKLTVQEAVVHTALDEPFMKLFGGNGTVRLLEKMGYEKGESLTHPLISASLKKAQDKLNRRVTFDPPARSQADWLRRNGLQQ